MAAGQQKKRLISSSLPEYYRGKKKRKLDSSDYVLNLRSQIYLELKDSPRTAVAKREQIGIKWTDMALFVESVHQRRSGLADVLCVPQEIYSLNNLAEVLSYEVWATCLSESERKLLTQFLPTGIGAEQAVQLLLSGENHHFGNPFLRWSTSLCSGVLHPDDILQRECQIESNKNQYYPDLNKYHTNMIEVLKNLKDRWMQCKDPEKLWSKSLIKPEERTLPISSERAKERPQKVLIHNLDIAKYMSYIKVSKKQLEAIKNLKHSGDGIQSKSLTRVLGDINSFHVHSYEALEGEEKLRLHEHWLQLINKDLPKASTARKENKSRTEKLMKSLMRELSEKRTVIMDKIETDKLQIPPQDKTEGVESELDPEDAYAYDDVSASINHDHHQELGPIGLDKEETCQDLVILGDDSSVISQFNEKENIAKVLIEPKAVASPVKNMWQVVDDGPIYHSSNGFSLMKAEPIKEMQAPIIDLERDIEQEAGQSDDASLFSIYASQNQANPLPSFAGSEILSPYPHVNMNHMKQPELPFLMANGNLSQMVHFPHQFQEQQNLFEQRMNNNIFSNGRYPSQELYSSGNGELVDHNNWFPNEHRAQNNYWPGVEPSMSNSDGSLFSVLSGCRNMQPQPQNNNRNSEHLMEARNFGPNNESIYGYLPQFGSSIGHGAAAPVSTSAMHVPYMNYQQPQNLSRQDSVGKTYRRSWNQ